MHLRADRVDIGELEGVDAFVLALAQNADASGWNLIFMLPLDPDDEDGYSISTHEGATALGGVTAWQRDGVVFRLSIEQTIADGLGIEPDVAVEMGDGQGELAADAVEDALRHIIG
ncbi:hypothetical protein GCM10027265_04800 [Jatrophihabitans fulvus]